EVECGPLADFPGPPRTRPTSRRLWFGWLRGSGGIGGQGDIQVFILAGVVHRCARIKSSEPRLSRAVVEQARIGAVMRQRARKRRATHKSTRNTNAFANWSRLELKSRQVGSVNGES